MRPTLHVCLLAGLLTLCLVKAAANPITGTWEGSVNGVKAVTLTVRETEGILGGSAIFYIVRDEGSGTHNGAALPAVPLAGTQWDGNVLRFFVTNGDHKSIAFELRVTSEGKGEFRRPPRNGEPEERVAMLRAR